MNKEIMMAKCLWVILVIVGCVHLCQPTEYEVHEKGVPAVPTSNENTGAEDEPPRILLEASMVDPVVEPSSLPEESAESAPTMKLEQKGAFLDELFHKPEKVVTVHKTKTVTIERHNPWTKTVVETRYINTCGTGGSSSAARGFFANLKDIEPTEAVAPNLATLLYDNVIEVKVYDFDPENQLL